jgi:hypothetical protein
LARTVTLVINCSPDAALGRIFSFLDAVPTAVRQAKCDDSSAFIDRQVKPLNCRRSRWRNRPIWQIWGKGGNCKNERFCRA